MGMAYKTNFPNDLAGPRGLLLAVIEMAVRDATRSDDELKADAWAYLAGRGGVYWRHLQAVGLPAHRLPKELQRLADEVTHE